MTYICRHLITRKIKYPLYPHVAKYIKLPWTVWQVPIPSWHFMVSSSLGESSSATFLVVTSHGSACQGLLAVATEWWTLLHNPIQPTIIQARLTYDFLWAMNFHVSSMYLNLTLALKEQLEFSRYKGGIAPAPNCLTQENCMERASSSGPQTQSGS